MGASMIRAMRFACIPSDDVNLVMVGLDASGKSTILTRLNQPLDGTSIQATTVPTVGFNVDKFSISGAHGTIWDLGGQSKLRQLWEHYLMAKDGIIFVVDSFDSTRVDDTQGELGNCDNACDELHGVLSNAAAAGLPLLVLCNKQDIPGVLPPETVINRLGLHLINDREVKVVGSCGLTGAGLVQGITWLARAARRNKRRKANR